MLANFDSIDANGLCEICNQRWPEALTLEFKRELPAKDDKGRSEFMKDVCDMANSSGGDIVFGITDDAGSAKAVAPISDQDSDAAIRRLGQILEARIEPRLSGVRFRSVCVTDGYCLLLRVPASFVGPHR